MLKNTNTNGIRAREPISTGLRKLSNHPTKAPTALV
jgi:hypothetical protein